MTEIKWSSKRVLKIFDEFSNNQKNFKTKPSGQLVKETRGFLRPKHGYLRLESISQKMVLCYEYPYLAAYKPLPPGLVSIKEMGNYLMALGPEGLKAQYKELEAVHVPREKKYFEEDQARIKAWQSRAKR
jgi:hypothetical protein